MPLPDKPEIHGEGSASPSVLPPVRGGTRERTFALELSRPRDNAEGKMYQARQSGRPAAELAVYIRSGDITIFFGSCDIWCQRVCRRRIDLLEDSDNLLCQLEI